MVSRERAQEIAKQFVAEYPGALRLLFYFRGSVAELYGARAGAFSPKLKGGYVGTQFRHGGKDYNGRVDVVLDNMADEHELELTLRHEVAGHYALNTLLPRAKRAILDAIIASQDEPTLKPLWAAVNEWYAGRPLDELAEEVYALRCESLPSPAHVAQLVREHGRSVLAAVEASPGSILTLRDLGALACTVADNLRDRHCEQLTFLGVNDLRRRNPQAEPIPLPPSLSGGLLARTPAPQTHAAAPLDVHKPPQPGRGPRL